MHAHEINFDGLVGPTHNYAGLSRGSLALSNTRSAVSNPRKAAREGLAKMKWLADLGVKQAVFPPHERPSLTTLRAFGFSGTDAQILRSAAKQSPELLAACTSACCMWMANSATVAPSIDTTDGRVHFTPANLASKFHRAIEPAQTARTLRAIFRDETQFVVHDPIPSSAFTGDEGGANHTRLASAHDARGLHLFSYGHSAFDEAGFAPQHFHARQALESSQAVARLQRLGEIGVCFAQQNPAALEAGAYHSDVVAVGNENVFLYHELAFVRTAETIADLQKRFQELNRSEDFMPIEVPAARVSLSDAVRSHLFNSQLVTLEPGRMALIAPRSCEEFPSVHAFLQELLNAESIPIREVRYFDLKESMRNGGGPACLRLRVVLTEEETALLPPGIFLDEALYVRLNAWIRKHYRDRLTPADFSDPLLLEESHRALDELTEMLGLGSIYPFQQV